MGVSGHLAGAPKLFTRFSLWLVNLPRAAKLTICVIFDAAPVLAISLAGVYGYELLCQCVIRETVRYAAAMALGLVTLGVFVLTGLYRPMLRYRDPLIIFPVLVSTASAAGLIALGASVFSQLPHILPMTGLLWLGLVGLMLVWRLTGGAVLNLTARQGAPEASQVAIYGAGRAGVALAEAMAKDDTLNVVCFVDDDSQLQGRTVQGIKVRHAGALRRLAGQGRLDLVVLALPSASPARRAAIINQLAELQVKVETAPSLEEIISGWRRVSDIRAVSPEELLSREPVAPDLALLEQELRGRAVMVTGGGGSIGSAIARAVIAHAPSRLIIFEMSEFALYSIERELREQIAARGGRTQLICLLGSVLDDPGIKRALAAHRPEIIYHAAAYKHVPLVELNPIAGASNNITGTLNVARAAEVYGAKKFVLISTDKAVRPANVMGAAKRVAEKVVEALGQSGTRTAFAMVRFGNVLDSAGSAVPLFREQIRNGGPVTVTDPRMVRYFMTIPEAADLVIQAGAMAQGDGDIFHLDMGEPVNVADLARKLIHLSGFSVREPGVPGDIEIQFTGLRPGEKLFEELLVDGKSAPTVHPRIFRASSVGARWEALSPYLERLERIFANQDVEGLSGVLGELVESYCGQRAPQAGPSRPGLVEESA
ncbi:MAG: polysaccharide biosynthesis protein [Pseudomonadota bacterium]